MYRFCAEFSSGVFPVKGRETIPKNATVKEFSDFTTPMGTLAYSITVDLYKERWAAALRGVWSGQGMQPIGHFNAPIDCTDKQLKELTVETKREKVDSTGKRVGFEWYRPSGAKNELWDLLIYASAALDIIAWGICRQHFQLDFVNWPGFFNLLEQQR